MKLAHTPIRLLFIVLFSILVISCRTETITSTNIDDKVTLQGNSSLAKLLLKLAKNDGSKDNILDNTSCFSVALPVTIIVNDTETIITSEQDFNRIVDTFAESDDDNDKLKFIFPIAIISSDFVEMAIENADQLEAAIKKCKKDIGSDEDGDEEDDEDLECIDFRYPIAVSVFNADRELIKIIPLEHDKALFKFIRNLDNYDIANIVFPVIVKLSDDSEMEIKTSEELEVILESVSEECDENDLDIKNFVKILVANEWDIQKFKDNEKNETKNYNDYTFNFEENGTSVATTANGEVTGTWSVLTRADGGLNVTFDFGDLIPLDKLNKEWNVKKVKNKRLMLDDRSERKKSKDELFFQQIKK